MTAIETHTAAERKVDGRSKGNNIVDRVGHRYGRLVVLAREGTRGTAATWLCQCDCGSQKVVAATCLRAGYTSSCGCSRRTGPGSRPSYTSSVPPGRAARRTVLKGYKGAARHRGLEWALPDDQFYALTTGDCTYCGVEPSTVCQPSRNGSYVYNGIDRVDNDKGYISDNVVSCCNRCNHAKRDMPQAEFLAWIGRLAAHLEQRRSAS